MMFVKCNVTHALVLCTKGKGLTKIEVFSCHKDKKNAVCNTAGENLSQQRAWLSIKYSVQ